MADFRDAFFSFFFFFFRAYKHSETIQLTNNVKFIEHNSIKIFLFRLGTLGWETFELLNDLVFYLFIGPVRPGSYVELYMSRT